MSRNAFSELADTMVPATATGLLCGNPGLVLATPLIAAITGIGAAGAAATVGAATAVGGLATAAVQVAGKGDEEEPAPPAVPEATGGHVSTLLAQRGGTLR